VNENATPTRPSGKTGVGRRRKRRVGPPTPAGTFYISYTVNDFAPGEENIGTSVVPITIHPLDTTEPTDDYVFEFITQFLNNGEVDTPFCDQYLTQGEACPVTFGASGLPAGLTLDPPTGEVTGTPTEAGTFLVTLTANDGTRTITTNLSMIIAPDDTTGTSSGCRPRS